VKDCTAIGFTAKADEQWPGVPETVHVEAVGIPPFPGHRFPRVVGLATLPDSKPVDRIHIVYLRGDALQPRGNDLRIVAHIVNDKAPRWGGGFSLALRRRFADVQEDFITWATEHKAHFRLGAFRLCLLEDSLAFASMVAQHGYGQSQTPRIRYEALGECLAALCQAAKARQSSVHMPRIGAGQARGSWAVISEMIENALCAEGVSVTVYDLPEQPPPPASEPSLFSTQASE
jgi:hypothetical protein